MYMCDERTLANCYVVHTYGTAYIARFQPQQGLGRSGVLGWIRSGDEIPKVITILVIRHFCLPRLLFCERVC